MNRRQSLQLRLELLRMRGQIERTEVAAAIVELRTCTRRIGALAATVSSVGSALSGGGIGAVLDAIGSGRSLWAPVALAAVRAIRRHPAAAIALTVGVLAFVGWWVGRKRRGPEETSAG
jgi:hypothetical protein